MLLTPTSATQELEKRLLYFTHGIPKTVFQAQIRG